MGGLQVEFLNPKDVNPNALPSQGTILPGVTRDSVIEIARSRGYEVIEEPTSVVDAMEADEIFTSGTAVVVCSVGSLTYKGKKRTFTEPGKPGADAPRAACLAGSGKALGVQYGGQARCGCGFAGSGKTLGFQHGQEQARFRCASRRLSGRTLGVQNGSGWIRPAPPLGQVLTEP